MKETRILLLFQVWHWNQHNWTINCDNYFKTVTTIFWYTDDDSNNNLVTHSGMVLNSLVLCIMVQWPFNKTWREREREWMKVSRTKDNVLIRIKTLPLNSHGIPSQSMILDFSMTTQLSSTNKLMSSNVIYDHYSLTPSSFIVFPVRQLFTTGLN